MSDEQRMGLALVLMVVVLMLWSHFYKPPVPPKSPETNPPAANVAKNVQSQQPSATSPNASAPAEKPATSAQENAQAAGPVKEAKSEENIVVESSLYRVELSNRGGVVRSWKLEKYRNNENPPKPLELVNSAATEQLKAWPLSVHFDDPKLEAAANQGLYIVKSASNDLRAPAEVDFEWSDGHLDVSKSLRFGIGYETEVSISATLDGKPLPASIAWRGGFGDLSVPNAAALTEVFYSESGKTEVLTYKKLGVKDHPAIPAQVTGYMDAAGIEDTFFTAAFLSSQPGIVLWDWTQQQSVTAEGKTSLLPVAEMAAGPQTPGPWSVQLYVGPKELSELDKLQPSLTGLVQFGSYFGFIAKGLLWVLKWTYKYVPNYGWDIVLLTIAINMALFPLKVKQWHSTKRMQAMMPKQKAIQEKYKKYSLRDPRRRQMQEEIGALYKEHGVNPLGSCLPQVVQLPIWWALYRMLEYSIELRHAPWMGWIHDLSAKDPYYILPVVLAIAGFAMTKMTPQMVTDAAQQKLMTYMPVLFGLFFINLSSGLVLYVCASYIVGAAQQWYLNRADPLPSRSPFKNKPAKA